jgi:hypothetical protein
LRELLLGKFDSHFHIICRQMKSYETYLGTFQCTYKKIKIN